MFVVDVCKEYVIALFSLPIARPFPSFASTRTPEDLRLVTSLIIHMVVPLHRRAFGSPPVHLSHARLDLTMVNAPCRYSLSSRFEKFFCFT